MVKYTEYIAVSRQKLLDGPWTADPFPSTHLVLRSAGRWQSLAPSEILNIWSNVSLWTRGLTYLLFLLYNGQEWIVGFTILLVSSITAPFCTVTVTNDNEWNAKINYQCHMPRYVRPTRQQLRTQRWREESSLHVWILRYFTFDRRQCGFLDSGGKTFRLQFWREQRASGINRFPTIRC